MSSTYFDLFKRTLIVVGVLLVPVLVWYLFNVILIAFGAIIFAMMLWLGAEPLIAWLSLREAVALSLSGLLMLVVIVLAGLLVGTRLGMEMQDVIQRVDSGAAALQASLEGSGWGKLVLQHVAGPSTSFADTIMSVLKMSSNVVEGMIIALISGIYVAAQPRLYRDGFVQLFPPDMHAQVIAKIEAVAQALRLWLIGQLIQMMLIGTLAALAVWMIGVPSPAALGLIAGIGEFVPYIGPIVAAIPAVLVALTIDWQTALWTCAAYLAINQLEGHLIIPLIQRHLVFIPPAVILIGIVAITSLFGGAAVIFAAPISVVIFVAIKIFYVRDTLGEETQIPGGTD